MINKFVIKNHPLGCLEFIFYCKTKTTFLDMFKNAGEFLDTESNFGTIYNGRIDSCLIEGTKKLAEKNEQYTHVKINKI